MAHCESPSLKPPITFTHEGLMGNKQMMDFHQAMEEVNDRFDNMIAEDILYSPLNYREIGDK
jgi:hypothetical protein